MIAVAFIVTTLSLGSTVERSITDALAMQYRGTDYVLEGSFSTADLDRLLTTTGVVAAEPMSTGFISASVPGQGTRYGLAETLADPGPLRWQNLSEGAIPRGSRRGARRVNHGN